MNDVISNCCGAEVAELDPVQMTGRCMECFEGCTAIENEEAES